MDKRPYILIVEDEEPISLLIQYNLEKEGFETAQAFDADQALEKLDERIPDLIILDWMIPGMNGIEVLKDIRSYDITKSVPVIMLTAKEEESDKIKGFDSGADDYLTKPFSTKELIARIKSVLKRAKPQLMEKEFSYSNIIVHNSKKIISVNRCALKLSPTEYDLLEHLVINAEKVCTRENLINNVWQDEEIEPRAVDVSIRRVRAIMQKASPGSENLIKTIRGEGYILSET